MLCYSADTIPAVVLHREVQHKFSHTNIDTGHSGHPLPNSSTYRLGLNIIRTRLGRSFRSSDNRQRRVAMVVSGGGHAGCDPYRGLVVFIAQASAGPLATAVNSHCVCCRLVSCR